ncbi:endonuclease I family protein [Marinomonas mediterranea]|jgi:Endonuclease I|uniref:Endonuclease I n=1 Tax=Marinomonas mediterranea (strain ATCC 700492 / JCM 21426 / NBRC 103028 / MMB-1) TaxID=717774 RepID=F2K248_MARM1|nr:endonuclease [Marinomonas mediterranea]ADZ91126.1 Endonuclease I [Marinomonas mediterranea MMB-1]WCN17257.1 endonuclease I [Marinomonas mediterranea MMB-1]
MFQYLLIALLGVSTLSWASSNYYAGTEGLTGANLKAKLHSIIDGQDPLPYTSSGNDDWYDGEKIDVWEALVYTDSACPATQPDCGLVQLLYLDETRSIDQANRGASKNDSWDREHVWPKSRGFKKKSQDGYTDLHHLRPADRNINGTHSNYGYDEGGDIVYDKLLDGSQRVSGAYLDKTAQSFEPTDRAKGQIARMIFYMATRYEIGDGQSPENMPDLVLADKNQKQSGEPWIGDLCTLVKWNNEFEVTVFERTRNDRVEELQGNRNPFIDHPEFVDAIWASKCP